MTTDLHTQIRDFAAEFSADLPPIDIETVFEPVDQELATPVRGRPSLSRVPKWVLAVVSALAVVVLVGGIPLVFGGPGNSTTDAASPSPCGVVPALAPPVGSPSTGCGLTDLRLGFWQAFNNHDADTVLSYMKNPATYIVHTFDGEEFQSVTYRGEDLNAFLDKWFNDGVTVEHNDGFGQAGGASVFHWEVGIYQFTETGQTSNAIDIWEFTTDPFSDSQLQSSPIVTHHSYQIGQHSISVNADRINEYLHSVGDLAGFNEHLATLIDSP